MSRYALFLSIPLFVLGVSLANAWPSSEPEVTGVLLADQLTALDHQVKRYETIVNNGSWPSFKKGSKITPGATNERVGTLREILTVMGDYKPNNTPIGTSNFYDTVLQDAVMSFQIRHGLEPDGIIGASTQAALAVPAEDRLAALHVTADKIRTHALSGNTAPTSILINIPAYTLYALEDQKVADTMKVIVGAPKNRTPLMENEITYLQFNPAWYVPSRIAANEMLPKIKNDPNYLNRSGYNLSQNGTRVDPTSVNWEDYGRGNFPFSIVQPAGKGNALGKVKFHMPDSDAIYLHDTAKPQLFSEYDRALSHGCVRLENPLALAQFVLNHSNKMTAEEAEGIYNKSRQQRVALETPVPVSIVYWTAWVDTQTNQPNFYRDVYSKDGALIVEKKKLFKSSELAMGKN